MSTSEPTAVSPRHPSTSGEISDWRVDDGAEIWALVEASTLDTNSPYAYLLWGDHFAATSRTWRDDEGLGGFVMGYRVPAEPTTLFVWQVAVDARCQGLGVASRLLDAVCDAHPDVTHLESTVTPTNTASQRLFSGFAARRDAPLAIFPAFAATQFPPGEHEAEDRFRIGPFTSPTSPSKESPSP